MRPELARKAKMHDCFPVNVHNFFDCKSEYSHFDSLKSHKVHTTYASIFLSADNYMAMNMI